MSEIIIPTNNIDELISSKYNEFTLEEQKIIHSLYHKEEIEKTELYNKLKKVIFRMNPPTPKQFLDPHEGWISKALSDSLYDYIIEDFIEITDINKNYMQIVEYGATRTGKSFLARLLIMYCIVYVHCLRHPQLYYGLSPTTSLCIYIMCFKEEKVKQLLLDPIFKLLDASPRFKRIKFQDKVREEQYKNGLDNIYWSKAATFGELTLDSSLTLNLGTDFMSFIGSDLLMLIVSEIAFFIEKAGATHEEIFQLYSDGLDRIKATVGNNYLATIYLDTSANSVENPIERYILNDLPNKDKVFFRQRSRWEAHPKMFPKWLETKETFKICTGDGQTPPKIINTILDEKDVPKNLILDIPIDVREEFEVNLTKSIKDIAGKPTSLENKLISDSSYINNIFNVPILKNIESLLIAESLNLPEKLIWNQVKDIFFTKYNLEQLIFYRAPNEPRFIGIDLSHSIQGDITGFCLLHKEYSQRKKTPIYIVDMCFAIGAHKVGINLEAPLYFIIDLATVGNMKIKGVGFDQFQSQTLLQALQRYNINVIKQSVDKNIDPYQFLITCLAGENLKAGKNIFLKNNLESLIRTKVNGREKIDHTKNKTNNIYDGNFEMSTAGLNAKDVSDAVCQALWLARNDDYIPSTIFEDENKRFSYEEVDINSLVKTAWKKIHTTY